VPPSLQVYGDVWRRPPSLPLLAALLGTGAQLVLIVLSVITIALVSSLYSVRRVLVSSPLLVCVSVVTGSRCHRRVAPPLWQHSPRMRARVRLRGSPAAPTTSATLPVRAFPCFVFAGDGVALQILQIHATRLSAY
jgi:Endomembrane protein 70